jgi:hypothetical protein
MTLRLCCIRDLGVCEVSSCVYVDAGADNTVWGAYLLAVQVVNICLHGTHMYTPP